MARLEQLKKKYARQSISAMRAALFEDMSGGQVHSRNKTVIQSALIEHGYKDLAEKMRVCKPSNRCLNPYCDQCQRTLFENQRRRFKDNLIDPYIGRDQEARENVFFVTVLHALIPFEKPDDQILRFPTRKINEALDEARKQFKSVRRSFDDKINFIGAFELEAVNGLLVNLHSVKGQFLAGMNGMDIGLSDKFVLVHSHFMVDMSGVKPNQDIDELPVDQFKKALKKRWPSKKQVDVSRLYKNKPVKDSLKRLADYPLKFPIKYYFRFNDMSVENNVIIEGEKHHLIRSHETDVMAEMIHGVPQIGLNAIYIRMGISKASKDN